MRKSDSWLGKGSTESREVADYYDDWAKTYDKSVTDWEYRAPQQSALLIRKHLTVKGPVFDAGCGTGLTGKALKNEGFEEITGTDISPESVDIAAKSQAYSNTRVLDLQEYPFPFKDNYFAAVNCVGVLTYISDIEKIMREFIRITMNKGLIVFTHRNDLIEKTVIQPVLDKIENEKLWEKVYISEPEPYLPHNEDFADKIKVVYFAYRVTI